MKFAHLLAAAALALSGPALAHPAAVPRAAALSPVEPPKAPAPIAKPPTLVKDVEPDYPAALRATGAQGDVLVKGVVKADGTLVDPAVEQSSGSPELDGLALAAFRQWTFEPGLDETGAPKDTPIVAKLEFNKDSFGEPGHVGDKTCADFVVDVNWFAATFPGKPRKEMRLYHLMGGAFVVLSGGNSGAMLAVVQRMPAAYDATYDECVKHPDRNFVKVLRAKVF